MSNLYSALYPGYHGTAGIIVGVSSLSGKDEGFYVGRNPVPGIFDVNAYRTMKSPTSIRHSRMSIPSGRNVRSGIDGVSGNTSQDTFAAISRRLETCGVREMIAVRHAQYDRYVEPMGKKATGFGRNEEGCRRTVLFRMKEISKECDEDAYYSCEGWKWRF